MLGRGARFSEPRADLWLFRGGHFYLFEQEAELLALMQWLLLADPFKQAAAEKAFL